MAINSRTSFWQQMHLLARLVGVTALAAALCGCFFWAVLGDVTFGPYLFGDAKYTGEEIGLIVICCSAAVVGLALIFEVRSVTQAVASHRGLFGFNVILQIGLALAIVIGANLYSFEHFRRFDLTRDQIFTLDHDTRKQLEQLRGDTDIIIVQNYVSFGQSADNKQDKYDFAAQRKIVEKVKDLAEQFGDLGPRFHVHVLDVQEDSYDQNLAAIREMLSKDAKGDRDTGKAEVARQFVKAIEEAPENSVFVFSRDKDRYQRISFSDIYQLDKQGSIDQRNLVLKYQGVGPFAHKIFNIEEKSPRIASAVFHTWLSLRDDSQPNYTMNGAKKALESYGFRTVDIALRNPKDGEPAILTHDESQYEDIEDDLGILADEIDQMQKAFDKLSEQHKFWSESNIEQVNKKYAFVLSEGRVFLVQRSAIEKNKKAFSQVRVTNVREQDRLDMVAGTKADSERLKHALDADREEQAQLIEKKSKLQVDSLAEKRRFTDLEAKAKAMLANVDLLIVPRLTAVSIPQGEVYSTRYHRIERGQLNAVKAFLKEGKPVLFLLGPSNNEPRSREPFDANADGVEPMLEEIGFYLPKQIILYDAEKREFNERKFADMDFGKSKHAPNLPPLKFDDATPIRTWIKTPGPFSPHPIRVSMGMANRMLASSNANADAEKKQKFSDASAIRVRHPRPVYFTHTTLPPEAAGNIIGSLALPGLPGAVQAASIWARRAQRQPDENDVFLITGKDCWNEENPFIIDGKVPRFAPTEDDSPKKGTMDEERRGPFPIGVAVETRLPASWFDKDAAKPHKARVAVIGSGGIFIGQKLPPLKEKLFLDTVNWLLGRDDLLARDAETWEYPRVSLTAFQRDCWCALCYGLPWLFIYLGTTVWLVRRMR